MASANDPHEDDSPWTQRGFILAAAVVAVIVVLALVLAFSGGKDSGTDAQTPAAQSPPATPQPVRASAKDGGSICHLPVGSQDVPTGPPPSTKWELVGSMAAPTAPRVHGPGLTRGGFRTCFARSPRGALYAAVNFWATSTSKDPAEVIKGLAADSAIKSRAIKDAEKHPERLDAQSTLQVAGFNFTGYDQDSTSVDLAFRLQNGNLLRVPTVVRWQDGDWKYVVPPSGNPGGGQLQSLDGYVSWKGA